MWSNLLSTGEAAKERFTTALKETNDALSQRASAHAQQMKKNENVVSPNSSNTSLVEGKNDQEQSSSIEGELQESKTNNNNTSKFSFPSNFGKNFNQQGEIFDSLKAGWGNVVSVTKNVVETTRDVVEKEQTRIQASLFARGPYMRDISLPLDSESLRDAEVVYLTDRLITMSHPAMQSSTNGDITPDRKLAAISHLLQKRHGGKFMVWNLSELEYDFAILQDQVMTYEFPGSPSPPLGMMLKILLSVESWLKADERNVAVMHCLTGRGRTSTVMAAFLCWMGEAGFDDDPNKALEYIAHCKRISPEVLTIPSQRRYISYFKNMMDGVRPNQPPILLKRIIMSEAPKFGRIKKQTLENSTELTDLTEDSGELGCSPYLQVFKAGKLMVTTAASKSYNQSKDDLPFCVPSDGSITFPVETIVQGDILIRCRHLTRKGQRVSMFRAAFHTGYTPTKVLRLSKAQLDGACNDNRYTDDFFIDLIFEECSAAMASKHLLSSTEPNDGNPVEFKQGNEKLIDSIKNKDAASQLGDTIAGSTTNKDAMTITASVYDSMVHRDSRFWDVITERRKKIVSGSFDTENKSDSKLFYGPTVGRRREFTNEVTSDKSLTEESLQSNELASRRSINSFSIGGELDFTTEEKTKPKTDKEPSSPEPTKKDDLMEALMAIDDDVEPENYEKARPQTTENDVEEVVFDVINVAETYEGNIVGDMKKTDTKEEDASHEIETSESKISDPSLIQVDDIDFDDDEADCGEFDFDDDDDELQDLEDFLTKVTS